MKTGITREGARVPLHYRDDGTDGNHFVSTISFEIDGLFIDEIVRVDRAILASPAGRPRRHYEEQALTGEPHFYFAKVE